MAKKATKAQVKRAAKAAAPRAPRATRHTAKSVATRRAVAKGRKRPTISTSGGGSPAPAPKASRAVAFDVLQARLQIAVGKLNAKMTKGQFKALINKAWIGGE